MTPSRLVEGQQFASPNLGASGISIIDNKSVPPGGRDPHHSNFDHLAADSKPLMRHGYKAAVDHPTDHGAAESVRGQERMRRTVDGRRREEGERAMMLGTLDHSWGGRPLMAGCQYPVDRSPTEPALSLSMAQSLHNRYDAEAKRDS